MIDGWFTNSTLSLQLSNRNNFMGRKKGNRREYVNLVGTVRAMKGGIEKVRARKEGKGEKERESARIKHKII